MKKYNVTSNKFTGTAELFYNAEGVLCAINCRDTNMSPEVIYNFKKAVPVTETGLISGQGFGAGTIVVAAGYRMEFEAFWKSYNKKINKLRCIPLYNKLSDPDTILCCEGIKPYDAFLKRVEVRQKLDPENWIRQRAWENDWKNA